MRKIIHIDMDAFFASIEQRDFPQYRGKPLIVGGKPDSRGVVAAASYEARKYGIHSAMPSHQAYKRCPHAIFVPPRFTAYRAVSTQIRQIMLAITPLVEPLSLDEAYLDVSQVSLFQGSATLIANHLRQQIDQTTHLTASAGVSYNKMLAKIASDINKPNGIAVITPEQSAEFIASLPIERFHGIGKATTKHMHQLGIYTGADLRQADRTLLQHHFGKLGNFYHDIAHGNDARPIRPNRQHKSIGSETTFQQDLHHLTQIQQALFEQNHHAFKELKKKSLHAHTITIKIKYANFTQCTRSQTLHTPFHHEKDAHYWISQLLKNIDLNNPVRLVGVTYSKLNPDNSAQPEKQMTLF